ncbi:MAG: hypothetical protein F6J95_009990 [Leptolyngbya sp. SIO1E4]|nr:hypothetical protein [Leptolyngbya sp. SIO1E4]
MAKLLLIALVIAYGVGAWRFWQGFHRTNFSQGKVWLTLLWPVYLIANKSYRENFNRALKG